jgi:hypothetical protein
MKTVILLYLLTTIISRACNAEEQEAETKEFFDQMELRIVDAAKKPNHEALPILSNFLLRLGDQKNYLLKSQGGKCLALAKNAMLQIPGHAKFVADEYEQFRKTEKPWDGGATRYHALIHKLANLPTPETIEVLGVYLEDFKDTAPTNLNIENQVIVNRLIPGGDGLMVADLPWLATYAIAEIGLRQPPLKNVKLSMYSFDPECTSYWQKTRAWYQEVKAGKRTFSFVGQKVEYRFKPDGTWDTIALTNAEIDNVAEPVIAPVLAPAKSDNVDFLRSIKQNTATDELSWWQWIFFASLLIMKISLLIAAKRRKQRSL